MNRRLATNLLLSFSLLSPSSCSAEETVTADADAAADYILSCRKPNGAFGPADQHYTDAAWNYPAVASLRALGWKIRRKEAVLKQGTGYPGGHVGYGHWHFFHVHRTREMLGTPQTAAGGKVILFHQSFEKVRYYGSPFGTDGDTFFKASAGPGPDPRDHNAETLGYYNLSSVYYLLEGLRASGREAANPGELIDFVCARQAPGGGFADVRTGDGMPTDEDAHVAHTFQALEILNLLNIRAPDPEASLAFLRSCQTPSGGFRFHPDSEKLGNVADVYYLWAAIKALERLGANLSNESECVAWINSLQNADGGFGDRPGWRSRLYSTWYAIDALAVLSEGNPADLISAKERVPKTHEPIPSGLQIFQGLHKMPVVSPADLKELHDRGFDLLALKTNDFDGAEQLRSVIRDQSIPMDVVLCYEAYPHRARRHGGALLHHICNPILDPDWTTSQLARWIDADLAGARGLNWPDYQQQVIRPLREIGSIVYPEQDFEMEYAYSAYDAGHESESGYNAVLAGFNWEPRDFVRVFPWRERYIDKLTPIADCDAHGDLAKWSSQLDHARHLFIAEGPTYEHFREAAAKGWVVCVIRNPRPGEPPATFYGRKPAVDFVKRRIEEWKWWQDD